MGNDLKKEVTDDDVVVLIADMRSLFGRVLDERNKAQVDADRSGRDNGELCDEVAALGEHVRRLEAALEWIAVGAGGEDSARRALLDMQDEDDDTVRRAWADRQSGRTAA